VILFRISLISWSIVLHHFLVYLNSVTGQDVSSLDGSLVALEPADLQSTSPSLIGSQAQVEEITSLTERRAKSPPDLKSRLENWGRVYENKSHPVVQEVWLLGRYHGQYHASAGNSGEDEGWENRRFRIGSQGRFYEKLTLHAQMVSGFDMQPFYNGFTELWTQWAFEDSFILTVGQQKHRFTHDRNVSSRYITTLERSMLVNMFAADYTPAVTISGKADAWNYYTGVFSNATSPDMWDSFTNYDSGFSLLSSTTRDLEDFLDTETAFLNISYVYSDFNENATNLNRFKDGVSAALILTEDATSLVSEVVYGGRSLHGDALGINIQPGYFLSENVQLATRYQLAGSNDDQGLVAQRRYERPAGLTTGDSYQAFYAGINYYIAGHRIKWIQGIEYSNMSGDDLWTASIAFRTFWGPDSRGPFPMPPSK
jgi:phosphate-selective porin OprO/OprP